MEEKTIPYFSHEGDMARMERTNRRLFIVVLVLIAALLGTNAGWLYYESQFTDEETMKIEAEQETSDGNNYIVGGNLNEQAEGHDYKNENQNQENWRQ